MPNDEAKRGPSPQVGVRFPPAEMERLRNRADRDFAGNVSTLVKVAVKRLMEATEQEKTEVEAAA